MDELLCGLPHRTLTAHVTSHSGQNDSGNAKQLLLFNQIKLKAFIFSIDYHETVFKKASKDKTNYEHIYKTNKQIILN